MNGFLAEESPSHLLSVAAVDLVRQDGRVRRQHRRRHRLRVQRSRLVHRGTARLWRGDDLSLPIHGIVIKSFTPQECPSVCVTDFPAACCAPRESPEQYFEYPAYNEYCGYYEYCEYCNHCG